MALSTFKPDAYGAMVALQNSTNKKLPGDGSETVLLISNIGPGKAVVLLGDDDTVTVTPSTGIAVLPGHPLALTISGSMYLAAVSLEGMNATLNLAAGS